jgi:hypothetical protein
MRRAMRRVVASSPVEGLRVEDVDASVIPEVDVDELVGAVSGKAADDQQPQIELELPLADTEVLCALGDRDAVVGDQPGHEGQQAGESVARGHCAGLVCASRTAVNEATTSATRSSGATATASTPAAQTRDTSRSRE